MHLTDKQQRCYDWIESYLNENARSPTLREIAAGIGYKSVAPVQHHLYMLRCEGLIDWEDGQARTLRLADPTSCSVRLNVDDAIALQSAKQRWDESGLNFGEELQRRLAA